MESLPRPLGTIRWLIAASLLGLLLGLESDLLAKLLELIEPVLEVKLVPDDRVEERVELAA